jgi:hypothetical protein
MGLHLRSARINENVIYYTLRVTRFVLQLRFRAGSLITVREALWRYFQ